MHYRASERGFSLLETMIAVSVLAVGALGAAGVLAQGLTKVSGSGNDVIATQKAAEAIESVFSARDSHVLTWAQLRNVYGLSGGDGGVFLDGARPVKLPGPDGLINTADDADQPVETIVYPGPDQIMGTMDDKTVTLNDFTREIQIRDINTDLRSITVTVTYRAGSITQTYTLVTYISNYS